MATDLTLVTATPTIDTAVYGNLDRIGSVMTFTAMGQANGGSGFIVGATLEDDALSNFSIELWLFRNSPTMVGADNAAFDLTDANYATADAVGVIRFDLSTSWTRAATGRTTPGMNVVSPLGSAPMAYKCAAGDDDLYGVMKALGAYDAAATDDITIKLWALRLS